LNYWIEMHPVNNTHRIFFNSLLDCHSVCREKKGKKRSQNNFNSLLINGQFTCFRPLTPASAYKIIQIYLL